MYDFSPRRTRNHLYSGILLINLGLTQTCWGLHILAQHPDVQERLREEVKHLNNPTFEQIESCRYLNNVCREILRFIPPGTTFYTNLYL